jgi:hypothetical protein
MKQFTSTLHWGRKKRDRERENRRRSQEHKPQASMYMDPGMYQKGYVF